MFGKYSKLKNGTWGARVRAPVKAGDVVTLQTRAGEAKEEIVQSVLWTGPDKFSASTVCLVSLKSSEERERALRSRNRGGRYECSECGDYVDAGTRCWEAGFIH